MHAFLPTPEHYSRRGSATATQVVFDIAGGHIEELLLPAPDALVMPGVQWGRAEAVFTPAFWAAQAWYHRASNRFDDISWGEDLREEVVACLLGGHGISAEMNEAAFKRLQRSGVIQQRPSPASESVIYDLLRAPLDLGGRAVRYRFPSQKGRFVAAALRKMWEDPHSPSTPLALRQWLLSFPGIGMKTASWISRNHLRSGEVAVIDIHIFRAGVIMGLFSGQEVLPRDYLALEEHFLQFADCIRIPAETLDVIIWRTMKDSGRLALTVFRDAA